jgi:hypothetical protein
LNFDIIVATKKDRTFISPLLLLLLDPRSHT